MFIGMIGYAYVHGLSVLWIALCALIGDFCASLFVHKNLRIASEKLHALSFCEVLSNWGGVDYKILRKCAAIILVIFLSIYAAAQFSAGGKALHVLFGWNYKIGAIAGAFIVLCYCFVGGIRASIWTNTAQAFVMLAAMLILFFTALQEIGGFNNFANEMKNISPQYFSLFPQGLFIDGWLGLAMFVFGWFFGGFGIVGQPHIMTSFMAMNKPENIGRIRVYYYSWYIIFYFTTVATGFAARLLIPFEGNFDPELALPKLSQQILPDLLIGLILAGLFSATMSTADSQIINCSGAINNDLITKNKNNYFATKLTTALIALVAMTISVVDNQSVFSLAMIGWLVPACAFGPLITIYALGGKMSQKLAMITMFSGFGAMMLWRYLGFGSAIYEAAPGMLFGTLPYLINKFFNKK